MAAASSNSTREVVARPWETLNIFCPTAYLTDHLAETLFESALTNAGSVPLLPTVPVGVEGSLREGLKQLDRREIDRHGKRDDHIVREQVERHMGQDLDNLFVIEPGLAQISHVAISDSAAPIDKFQREAQRRLRLLADVRFRPEADLPRERA